MTYEDFIFINDVNQSGNKDSNMACYFCFENNRGL